MIRSAKGCMAVAPLGASMRSRLGLILLCTPECERVGCSKAIGSAQGQGAERWLPPILAYLPEAYRQSHFSGYLYLASHVVRSCGSEQSPHRAQVALAVMPMIQDACSRIASLTACNQSPHDADDLFLMAYKGLLHAPSLFLERALLEQLLQVAAVGLLVQHQDAFRSIQSFLFRLLDAQTIACAPDRQATQAMLQVRTTHAPGNIPGAPGVHAMLEPPGGTQKHPCSQYVLSCCSALMLQCSHAAVLLQFAQIARCGPHRARPCAGFDPWRSTVPAPQHRELPCADLSDCCQLYHLYSC
jgi:hypothetical protein